MTSAKKPVKATAFDSDKKSKKIGRGGKRPGAGRKPGSPGGGGRLPGAGRKAGSQNKATLELKEAAKIYTFDALDALIKIAKSGKSESARVAAACAILDRGYGKPKQQIEADMSGNITLEMLVLASMKLPEPSLGSS